MHRAEHFEAVLQLASLHALIDSFDQLIIPRETATEYLKLFQKQFLQVLRGCLFPTSCTPVVNCDMTQQPCSQALKMLPAFSIAV